MNPPLHKRVAAHEFTELADLPFEPHEYSALKFGSDRVARDFGYEMADLFYASHHDVLVNERCVVVPSAYNVVEIAATILAKHFMNRLNDRLVRDGHDIVAWTTMHRTISYLNDYADVSIEERKALLAQDDLYIKREFIAGRTILFVDDICITGTHEEKLRDFLNELGGENPAYFCYYAKYNGTYAAIEGELNRSGIRTLNDLLDVMDREQMHIMVRTLRLWLQADHDILVKALDRVDADYCERLYHAVMARGYHNVPELAAGFDVIRARHDFHTIARLSGKLEAAA